MRNAYFKRNSCLQVFVPEDVRFAGRRYSFLQVFNSAGIRDRRRSILQVFVHFEGISTKGIVVGT